MAAQIQPHRKSYIRGSWTLIMEDSDDVAYLLIGSTGQGKSSLGNFLLMDPDVATATQPFRTARSNKPETRRVESQRAIDGGLRVVDTPGLNESDVEDLEHMIDLVTVLQRLKYISACILCVRFESKIDAQYKATVDYYRNLLPMLFEANVVIVVTNFQADSRSEALREMQGIDVNEVIKNFQDEVVKIGHLTYRPQVFKIDSIPVDDAERQLSVDTRRAILDYINHTLVPVDVRGLMVAKTAALLQLDAEKVAELDGEITGYNNRLQEVNQEAEEVLNEIEAQKKVITGIKLELNQLKLDLRNMDTDQPMISGQWSLEQDRKLFKKQSKDFKVNSRWPITHHTKWDNGHLLWKEFNVEEKSIWGTVEGEFFRGLYASITLWTTKRHKYERIIWSIQKDISRKTNALADSVKQYREFSDRQHNHRADIQLLEKYIHEINEKKAILSQRMMTLDEASTRLQELKL